MVVPSAERQLIPAQLDYSGRPEVPYLECRAARLRGVDQRARQSRPNRPHHRRRPPLSLSDRAAWVRCQLRRGPNTERMSGSAGSDDAVPPNTVRSLLSCMSLVKPGMVSRPGPPGTPVSGSGWICA